MYPTRRVTLAIIIAAAALQLSLRGSLSAMDDDASIVARLDERYQAAVKMNDIAGMDSILDPEFTLVVGRGNVYSKRDLLASARAKEATYEHQEDTQRQVRLYGNTAVVTALLWEKGVQDGKPFDKHLWFSDVYVRTSDGWRYVFGQVSLPLP